MNQRSLGVSCLVIIMISIIQTTNAKASGKTLVKITSGLTAGEKLAGFLKDGNFGESLEAVGKNLAPFLSAIGPLASFAFQFITKRDSKELAYMKRKFKEVNNKLDIIIAEFDDVKKVIEWNGVLVSYGTYERKIRAAKVDLTRAFSVEGQTFLVEKDNFIKNYENQFDNSLQKIYDVIVNNDHVISKNILAAANKKTGNHKRKFEKFSLGLIQLLTEGIEVKVAYYALRNITHSHVISEWDRKMKNVKRRVEQVSQKIKNAYLAQLKEDVEELIKKNYNLENRDMLMKIYNFVEDKFDWRHWFVAVYADIKGWDKHSISACGGHTFLRKKEKNVVVASQEKKYARRFKAENAAEILEDVIDDINDCSWATRAPGDRARTLHRQMQSRTGYSCIPYALEMAVQTGNGLWYIAPNGHVVLRSVKKDKWCKWDCSPKKICNWWRCSWAEECTSRSVDWWYNMLLFG